MKEIIELSEEQVLQMRLMNTQMQLIDQSLENLELKKKLLLSDRVTMNESFQNFKREISEMNKINYEDYLIDLVQKRLVLKK